MSESQAVRLYDFVIHRCVDRISGNGRRFRVVIPEKSIVIRRAVRIVNQGFVLNLCITSVRLGKLINGKILIPECRVEHYSRLYVLGDSVVGAFDRVRNPHHSVHLGFCVFKCCNLCKFQTVNAPLCLDAVGILCQGHARAFRTQKSVITAKNIIVYIAVSRYTKSRI